MGLALIITFAVLVWTSLKKFSRAFSKPQVNEIRSFVLSEEIIFCFLFMFFFFIHTMSLSEAVNV